jgi:LEA14-like dessication related protein
MPAATYNTTIDQGADWYLNFNYQNPNGTPVNITGYTAALQLRTSPLAKTTALSLTTGSGITITGSTGLIAVHATATQTGAITNGMYVYDLEITSGQGVITRLIQGTINVSAQVTR